MTLPAYSMRQLLEAGVHFGHQAHRWNPKMAEFILAHVQHPHHRPRPNRADAAPGSRGDQRYRGSRRPDLVCRHQTSGPRRGRGRSQALGQYYVNSRWLGGTLTNWKTISHSIHRLRKLDEMLNSGEAHAYTKKERLDTHAREREARSCVGRHQGHGRITGPDVCHRHQQRGYCH